MGQTLSEPVTEKHSESGGDKFLMFGASAMQGWRISMEDAHTAILELAEEGGGTQPAESEAATAAAAFRGESAATVGDPEPKHHSFFAVYDGHGGQAVAIAAGAKLHQRIAATDAFKKADYAAAMQQGFLAMDEELKQDPELIHDPSGCTAVAALVVHETQMLYVANAGDSRAVLSVQGEAKPMSWDHKPGNQTEVARIIAAGGFVEFGRVNGNLALSRALGDFEFKQNPSMPAEEQIVTAFPDVEVRKIEAGKGGPVEFLVLACDGIWDVMSNQDVVNFCRRLIADGKDLDKICELLMDRCLAPDRRASELGGIGCDNMTVVLVAFLGGLSPEEWRKQIKERYDADRAARGADADATDGSEDYTDDDGDGEDASVP